MASLPDEKRLHIERAVEQLTLDTGLSYPENGLIEIANRLGADVVEAPLPPLNDKKVKGFIRWFNDEDRGKKENKPFTARIYLNKDQFSDASNFTLAHEIGHFILHKGSTSFRVDLQDYSEAGDPQNQETEANFFAGTLLMPKDKLLRAIGDAKNLQEVADAFAVSKPAVVARLKWLHLKIS